MLRKPKDIYYDDREEMPDTARKLYLDRKLHQAINNAYKYAPSAYEIMETAHVRPPDIQHIKNLVRLPITRKDDLIEWQKSQPPYGGFLAIKHKDIERVFVSPGPVYEPFHSARTGSFARALWAAGFRPGDIVINTFDYNLSAMGTLVHEGLRQCGATVVPAATDLEMQLQLLRDLKVNGYTGTPSRLAALIQKAEETGNFCNDFTMKRAWFSGEMPTPEIRERLESNYGISTSQAYTVTPVGGAIAYECPQKSGLHIADDYVVEIVDPETGNQLKPGETGEIVITPIDNSGWGLIRFGTGDLSSYTTEHCACGRTSWRLNGIWGKTS